MIEYLDSMYARALSEGHEDLILYLSPKAERELTERAQTCSGGEWNWLLLPRQFISAQARHGCKVILGETDSEWALALTDQNEIREF